MNNGLDKGVMWMGLGVFESGDVVVSLGENEEQAKTLLVAKWRETVGDRYNAWIKTFAQFAQWLEDVKVFKIAVNSAHVYCAQDDFYVPCRAKGNVEK